MRSQGERVSIHESIKAEQVERVVPNALARFPASPWGQGDPPKFPFLIGKGGRCCASVAALEICTIKMKPVRVEVNDKMQKGYVYFRTKPMGRAFRPGFTPQLTPKQMLNLGVFGGKYLKRAGSRRSYWLLSDRQGARSTRGRHRILSAPGGANRSRD